MSMKVAYLMSRFPHLPETFILREMSEMKRQGWDIALYPLIYQKQSVVHAEAKEWLPAVRKLPFISPATMRYGGHHFIKTPLKATRAIGTALKDNLRSPKFLARVIALLPKTFYAAEMMLAEGIDHIHAHYATHPAFAAWLIHRLTGIPYSITVHAHDIYVEKAMLETKIRDASFIAAISEFNRNYLADLYGDWVISKTHIVHCGLDPNQFQPRPQQGLNPNRPLQIINVGSLQSYKGQRYLVEACKLLHQQGVSFNCQIVGGGELGENLEKQIRAAGLTEHVKLLGPRPQEEVSGLLASSDCYVQPSIITPSGKMEGIPVALMEALACELPVIATNISGIPELVQPGKTGYLVAAEDPSQLANALTEVNHHPEQARQMARNGRQLVLREYNLATNARQLGNLILQVSGRYSASQKFQASIA